MTDNLRSNTISSLIWRSFETIGTQGVQFIVSIILARLLQPEEFGLAGIIIVFIIVSQVFLDSGFGVALVQKKHLTELDKNSVFYFTLFLSALLYSLLFFVAPLLALFYDNELLCNLLRVSAIAILFDGMSHIHWSLLRKEMDFKVGFKVIITSALISGVLGIYLAFNGFGVWAIIYANLTKSIISMLLFWIMSKWRPSLKFSFKALKELFFFGGYLLGSRLLDVFFQNLNSLVIAKAFSAASLGYFSRGKSIPNHAMLATNNTVLSVMLPSFSLLQDDQARFKRALKKSVIALCTINITFMFALMALSKPLIIILLTDKWLPSLPYFRILCLIYSMLPIYTIYTQAINALGHSKINLKINLIIKVLSIIALVITYKISICAILYGQLVVGAISVFASSYFIGKFLKYSLTEQLGDIWSVVLTAGIVSGVVYAISFFEINNYVLFVSQVSIFILGYLIIIFAVKVKSFVDFTDLFFAKVIVKFRKT